jgi:hypothetical protein
MAFFETAIRVWKALPREERLLAAETFFQEPAPELYGSALTSLVKARHMRPQAARSLDPDTQARILATVLDPGEPLAQGLLVSLHLGARRPLLGAFLDALGLPHENGVLTEEADSIPAASNEATLKAVGELSSFPPEQVQTYLNTLWLQDSDRWAALAEGQD